MIEINWESDIFESMFLAQVESWVDDQLPVYWETMRESIKDEYHWTNHEPFCNMRFSYEHARFTFNALCNIVEMIGLNEPKFSEELRKRVEEIVHHRYDVYMQLRQEDYQREVMESIERREAV